MMNAPDTLTSAPIRAAIVERLSRATMPFTTRKIATSIHSTVPVVNHYEQLVEKATRSHEKHLGPEGIAADGIGLARFMFMIHLMLRSC